MAIHTPNAKSPADLEPARRTPPGAEYAVACRMHARLEQGLAAGQPSRGIFAFQPIGQPKPDARPFQAGGRRRIQHVGNGIFRA